VNVRCDSHIHVVGPADRYPQVANRTYTADVAPLSEIERAAGARNVRRFVVVQPSFYGTDNTVTLESLDALAGRGRGVAVIDPRASSSAELKGFSARGVRGLRINLYSPLGASTPLAERFTALEAAAQAMNWHIEVIAPLKLLAEEAALLGRSKVPVVIDHYALYAGFAPDRSESRRLLDLLRLPHVWMKLSAPYRVSDDSLATRPDPDWLAAILNAASDRCVWGSDWPHTPAHEKQGDSTAVLPYRKLTYETVVDDFVAAVGSPELSERIMSENAARLYDFD
jgi:predicted TIM-barrel fold metal-dependent hydrolase